MESSEIIVYALFALLIQAVVLYFVIKNAVSDSMKENDVKVYKQLRLINQFKIRELLRQGVTQEEINSDIEKAFKK